MRRRRDVLLDLAAAAATWRAAAQEAPKSARIAFVVTGEAFPRRRFDEAMQRLGWIEGRNLAVDRRVTGEDPERRHPPPPELIAAAPDVIVAASVVDALPVHALTRSIPIVVIIGADLVKAGLAESLAHPGGNVTGMTGLDAELNGKRLELLRELVPAARQISVFAYARNPQTVPHHRHRGFGAPARRTGHCKTGERRGRFRGRVCDKCSRP